MYTNLPSQWAFEANVTTQQTIADGVTGIIAFSVHGANHATDIAYGGVPVYADSVLTNLAIGGLVIYNDNTLGLTITNKTGTTLTVAVGDKIRGVIAHCDNNFNGGGL
jgi:hypothetical protein